MSRWRAHVPNRTLADWERELLRLQQPVAYNFDPPPVGQSHNDVIKDAYDPMLRAALKGPITLPVPMSQR